jgi:hypothetical protein
MQVSSHVPPLAGRYGWRPRGEAADSQLRVSDTERSEIADVLSKHYSDGRLDEAEFNDRLQMAMSAKTRGDLAGLLTDLPSLGPVVPPERSPHRRSWHLGLLLVASFLLASALGPFMWPWHFHWLLFAIVLFVLWRASHFGWHRRRWTGRGIDRDSIGRPGGAGHGHWV